MLRIDPLTKIQENGQEITIGHVYRREHKEEADKYILIKVDSGLNQYVYIPKDEQKPQQIDDSTIEDYQCRNCNNEKLTHRYYGCTLENEDIRNKDILLCNQCVTKLQEIRQSIINQSSERILADII